MSDLISRQDAIHAIEDMPNAYNGWSDTYDKACIIGVLEEVPSAEQKTGKWKLDSDGMDWNIPAWRCSECGFVATHIGVEPNGMGYNPLNWVGSKFCPQCGARITGYER